MTFVDLPGSRFANPAHVTHLDLDYGGREPAELDDELRERWPIAFVGLVGGRWLSFRGPAALAAHAAIKAAIDAPDSPSCPARLDALELAVEAVRERLEALEDETDPDPDDDEDRGLDDPDDDFADLVYVVGRTIDQARESRAAPAPNPEPSPAVFDLSAMAPLVAEYSNAVGRHGPDSDEVRRVRARYAGIAGFVALADGLDRIKRRFGGSGMEARPAAPEPAPATTYSPCNPPGPAPWEPTPAPAAPVPPSPTAIPAGLRAALAPFVRTAAGIPDNWPGGCVLTIHEIHLFRENRYYHHAGFLAEIDDPRHPTIADWRRLAEVAGAGEPEEVEPEPEPAPETLPPGWRRVGSILCHDDASINIRRPLDRSKGWYLDTLELDPLDYFRSEAAALAAAQRIIREREAKGQSAEGAKS